MLYFNKIKVYIKFKYSISRAKNCTLNKLTHIFIKSVIPYVSNNYKIAYSWKNLRYQHTNYREILYWGMVFSDFENDYYLEAYLLWCDIVGELNVYSSELKTHKKKHIDQNKNYRYKLYINPREGDYLKLKIPNPNTGNLFKFEDKILTFKNVKGVWIPKEGFYEEVIKERKMFSFNINSMWEHLANGIEFQEHNL